MGALFDGAPPEEPVVAKPRGKILHWRKALYPDALAAIDNSRTDLALSNRRKNKSSVPLILRGAKKMFPKWCKRKPYQVKVFNRLLREILHLEEHTKAPGNYELFEPYVDAMDF